jgi:hypothetical protein
MSSQHMRLVCLLILSTCCRAILAQGTLNSTTPLSREFSRFGDGGLLCRAARWTDVLTFSLGNYVAHAATIRSQPDSPTVSRALIILVALAFPTFGLQRGIGAI